MTAGPGAAVVKICGLREAPHVEAAAAGGAALAGFVFAPSTRRIAPEQAAVLIAGMRGAWGARAPRAVGVFVNETPERMAAIAEACGLDVVQLSGDEAPDAALLAALGRPVIRMLRARAGARAAVLAEVAAWEAAAAAADRAAGVLRGPWGSRLLIGLDAQHGAAYGGTGRAADWDLAAALAARGPLMLAGGLTPANVSAALAAVRPWAVDVSSGVESGGRKDAALIGAFLTQARGTET